MVVGINYVKSGHMSVFGHRVKAFFCEGFTNHYYMYVVLFHKMTSICEQCDAC